MNLIYKVLLISLLASCNSKSDNKIIIRGSTTVLPIIQNIAELYQKKNPTISFNISPGGSGIGVASILNGTADIGMVSREITPKELKHFTSFTPRVIIVAKDAVTCAVSKKIFLSGVSSLSKKEIAAIYKGKIKNWKELGGQDAIIFPIDKEISRGTRHVFMNYIFGNKTEKAPGAKSVSGSNNEEQTILSSSNTGIGMLSLPWINEKIYAMPIQLKNNQIIKPTKENIRNGSYPILRNLNILINSNKMTTQLKKFINFIQSSEAQKIIEEEGFISNI